MADEASDGPASVRMEDLVAKASPGGDFAARQVLANLEARLFNRRRDPVSVGRYIIERRLGAGGSGTVYRAYDPQKDRKVALKLLHAGDGDQKKAAQARLLREAQTLAKINHENVVKVFDVGTYDSSVFDPPGMAKKTKEPGVYVAMELIEGVTLDTWLRIEARTWVQTRDVFVQAAWGLAAAHAKGLIHRDFKPANVLVADDGPDETLRAVVLDFGLARATDKQESSSHYGLAADAREHLKKAAAPIDATLTAPGTLLGTPAYMAPEQHARGRGTELSDQYALCLALYEAWYGHRPFFAETEQALEEAKFAEDVMPPPADTDVPSHLFAAVLKGMSAAPSGRHVSMEALIAALTAPPSRRLLFAGLAGSAALAITAGVLWSGQPPDPCSSQGEALRDAWGPASRAAVTATIEGSGLSYAATTLQRVTERLDGHAEQWRSAWAQACGAEPEARPGPRRDCLDQRRQMLRTLAEGLAAMPPERMERAVDATTRLYDPAECLDEATPWFALPPGSGAAAGALGRAEAYERVADYEHASKETGQALKDARSRNDGRALRLSALRHGSILVQQGRHDDAVEALADVVWSASGQEQRALAAAAATRLVELTLEMPTPHPDAPLWAQRARDAAARDTPSARARTLSALGRALLASGQTARALQDLELAASLLEPSSEAPTPEHVQVARALGTAALQADDATTATKHLSRAATYAETVYGSDHPRTGLLLRALSRAHAAAGDSREASTHGARAAEILGAALPADDPRRSAAPAVDGEP